jgi:hypothetical protein
MNDVDRRISDPHYNEPFLSWYAGLFDQVFLALHPFSTVAALDPEIVQYQTTVLDRKQIEGPLTLQKYVQLSQAANATKTVDKNEFAKAQKERGVRILWKRICEDNGISSFHSLNRMLMSQIGAVKEDSADVVGVEKLAAFCRERKIFFPTEDVIQPLMESDLARLLRSLGIEKVCLSNEFNENKLNLKTAQLLTTEPWDEAFDLGFKLVKAYPLDHSFLAVVPWDSFYTILCGKGTALTDAGVDRDFEGFWCTPDTKPEW